MIEIHESDSVTALHAFPDKYFDWIFIDGDHSYGGVRRDTDIAKVKIKPGGLLVFDDYIFKSGVFKMSDFLPFLMKKNFSFSFFCLDKHQGA